ncbi:winged helix-turn-helix transcriptional regulator [[Eubacterium] cellulosolvens]
MRRFVSMIVVLVLVLSGFGLMIVSDFTTEDASAFTQISGTITLDQIWSSVDAPFYIVDNVTILGANVTIQPGVDVFFNGSFKITVINGNLTAVGTKNQPIEFNRPDGTWGAIEIMDTSKAVFDWCKFINASVAIKLINNRFRTEVTNCTFESSCLKYFELVNSMLNATSSKFDNKQFDDGSVLDYNINNKLILADQISELYIQYFVNVNTVGPFLQPINNINVDVSDLRHNTFGRTNTNGQFWFSPATAVKINGTPAAEFLYMATVTVSDKWDGVPGREEPGISRNQTTFNASSEPKDSDLYIPVKFTFKYPPRIDTNLNSVKVTEDQNKTVSFVIHDNDDLDFTRGYNNLTFNITNGLGHGLYGSNGKTKWISWSNNSGGELYFYRTIESPFSPPKPNDYDAVVHEEIFITVIDPVGAKTKIGPVDVEYTNVPDKPVINGLPSAIEVVEVTEEVVKYLPIDVSDEDNLTSEIKICSSSKYVSYEYNDTNDQSLKLLFPNEYGMDKKQEIIYVNATDDCSADVIYNFLIEFRQTPDAPIITEPIPNKYGSEDNWLPELPLSGYAYDPDSDDDWTTLKWYVTGLDKKVFGKQLFDVAQENTTANTPLAFYLNSDIELGGARNPQTIKEKITVWLVDKDGLTDSQDIELIVNSTNQPPSMHKIDYEGKKLSVVPERGLTSDTYRFMVSYKDLDGVAGDAPEYVKVYIDGTAYEMQALEDTDDFYGDGKTYYYDAVLAAGEHEHYFECSDSEVVTRLPLITAEQINFSGPEVEANVYILKKSSPDGNFVIRLAHTNIDAVAEIVETKQPPLELEPELDNDNKTKGDIGTYFKINTKRLDSILWAEVTVKFGLNFENFNTTWLRKPDLQLTYYSPATNKWVSLPFSYMNLNTRTLICNLTAITGHSELLVQMLNSTNAPVFTIMGFLDADDDGYFNSKDAFPFDPAAREDRDKDGSPGRNEWVPGKGEKDSTTGLHEDKFPDDPAASIDGDGDGCPDDWNPGKSQKDSTSKPKLTLDAFLDEPGACMDTDGDGMPDTINFARLIKKDLIEDTDDDNDGLPDWWEEEMGQYATENNLTNVFDPKNNSDAQFDWDGDGRSNLDEYRKNTHPYKKDVRSADEFDVISILPFLIAIIIVILILIVFMYSKMRRDELLENKLRAKILEHINRNPGIHYRKILNDLNLQMGVLTHHLNMLERQQYIKSLQDSMYRRFYPINSPTNTDLILSDMQKNILQAIHDAPGISQAEVARNLGVARKVVNYHIRILSDADFIDVELSGRESQCYYRRGLDIEATVKA